MRKEFVVKAVATVVCSAAMTAALAGEAPVRIVPQGGLAADWVVQPGVDLVAPGYPQEFAARGDEVCIAMGYRVQADGTTSDVVMLRGWNNSKREMEPLPGYWDGYAQASAAALAQWRFAPKPGVAAATPVDTVAVMTFRGNGSNRVADLASQCAVPDLAARMQFARRQESGREDFGRTAMESSWYRAGQSRSGSNMREANSAASAWAAQQR